MKHTLKGHHNAGGVPSYVGGGTLRAASDHPAMHKRGGSGINSEKGPGGQKLQVSSGATGSINPSGLGYEGRKLAVAEGRRSKVS